MKLYAPKYYRRFRCIADRCEHSCCIGWEIDIDEVTLQKYNRLRHGYGSVVANSVCTEETPHFQLGAGNRCPHLDERGLCKIILHLGEDYLCDICREHPRFYNFTDVAEVGLGMSCIEAARCILSSPDFDNMEEIGTLDVLPDGVPFDGRAERSKIYTLLQDASCDYATALQRIYRTYSIDAGEDRQWLEILDSLEYLNADHKALLMTYSSEQRPHGMDDYRKRWLAYLLYRHTTEAVDAEDFSARLAFCLFCERLFSSLLASQNATDLQDAASLASLLSEEIEYSDDNTAALTYACGEDRV
jgi:lysine-N-methylase